MTRDILHEVFARQLSPDDVEGLVSQILASPKAPNIADELGMSVKEYTAYAHGAPFDVIAQWRYGGWPSMCSRCSKPLDSDKYGWLARELIGGGYGLVHVSCP